MDWDQYLMNLARAVSLKSKDRSTQVGCVIVGPDYGIRSTGYNGFPRGASDEVEERHQRPLKYRWTEHAERNALYNAAKNGTKLEGSYLYTPWFPCTDCARGIIQAGIARVATHDPSLLPDFHSRWEEECTISLEMLRECGVEVRLVPLSSEDAEEVLSHPPRGIGAAGRAG